MRTPTSVKRCITAVTLSLVTLAATAAQQFVSFDNGDIQVAGNGETTILVDQQDQKGVMIAARNLAEDFGRVTGTNATIVSEGEARIIVGTIGHSKEIDKLVKQGVIDRKALQGKLEKFIIQTTSDGRIAIAGSDRRGTIYGIYELSRQIGVSPWYWWADVPTPHHNNIYVRKGTYTDGEPAVRYRGLFLNDEAPCLTSWVKNTWGTDYGDHRFYAKVFELILRLRGNFMWPAMWSWAFYADDPENSRTADEMGVIMSTSHHEPMARNHQEYARHRKEYGAWNYATNKENLDKFFRDGIERMKGTEDVVTIGMRGDGDEAMSEDADTRLLQNIVENQRRIIKEVTGKPANKTPQVWALYKEVLDYYDKGMKVPDDVIMLLCDDNWGNVRRVPTAQERKHPGGWGLYYHVDYVGAPRNTKWLNVTPTQNMWEQLTLAYDYGLDRMWILNVGDLKPMEYPITLFMDMAWQPHEYNAQNLTDHTLNFCQMFGKEEAQEAAEILNLYCKYAGRSTAEMLDKRTYNLETGEWEEVTREWIELENRALLQYANISKEARDAYYQLVLFPVEAMSNVYQMYYAQAMNNALAAQNDPAANQWAERCKKAFRRDSLLCNEYNTQLAGGKWNGMMTQKHIGYTSWNDDFPADRLPELKYVSANGECGNIFCESNGYVSIEAEHYYSKTDAQNAKWTVIPFMGRTLSAMELMPQTASVEGASLEYRFTLPDDVKDVKVHVILKSTLDFLNKGGLEYSVSLDGSDAVKVNFNSKLNEKPENIYSIYYPTVARRVIETVTPFAVGKADVHSLVFRPLDPGVVIEKIVIDCGGYKPSYLFGKESPKK